MGSSFGSLFRISTFGESHGGGVGVIVDGCPPMLNLDLEAIQAELDRRKPGQSRITTPRKEDDRVEVLSGLLDGQTLGTPIAMVVRNKDQRPGDYKEMQVAFRPSHADATYQAKYGIQARSGGGRASARETIGRVAAGAVAKQLLHQLHGTEVLAWVKRIHTLEAFVTAATERLWDDQVRDGHIEWMSAIANRLPMLVVCRLLGVPDEDAEQLAGWGYASTQLLEGLVSQEQLAGAGTAAMQLAQYVAEKFDQQAADPQDTLMGALARDCAEGPALAIGGPALEGIGLYNAYYILQGGVVRARALAKRLNNAPLAIVDKRREKPGESEVMNIIGNVQDHFCIIIDDIVDSGGTLCNAAQALLDQGAASVAAYITHGVLSGGAVARVDGSSLKELVITDSIRPTDAVRDSAKVRILPIAPLIGEAVRRIADESSVSSLFD
mgnify:CR=1 FL=1